MCFAFIRLMHLSGENFCLTILSIEKAVYQSGEALAARYLL